MYRLYSTFSSDSFIQIYILFKNTVMYSN